MKTCKLAWVSDSHVGFRQYGLERREHDFRRAFEDAVNCALDAGAGLIIHSGDIIHNNRPSADTIACLQRVHDKLQTAGIDMLVISGNHDFSDPHWLSVVNPTNEGPGIKLIDGMLYTAVSGLKVYGVPWMPKEQFLAQKDKIPAADIILWHGAIQEFIGFPSASALALADLPLERCKLWAAGDIHVNKVIEHNGVIVGYPGSTELNSESEEDVKVVKILEWDQGTIKVVRDWALSTRPIVRLNLKTEADLTAAIEHLLPMDSEHKAPIVYVRFPQSIGVNVVDRLKTALNPDRFIIRPIGVGDTEVEAGATVQQEGAVLTPAELLSSILPADSVIRKPMMQLIDPAVHAESVIDQFIDSACA